MGFFFFVYGKKVMFTGHGRDCRFEDVILYRECVYGFEVMPVCWWSCIFVLCVVCMLWVVSLVCLPVLDGACCSLAVSQSW